MKGVFLFIPLFFSLFLHAQIKPGARQIAAGNSFYAQADDVFSLFYNPAGLAQIPWSEFTAYYSPSPFGLKEMANGNFAANYNFDFLSAALGAQVYGFDLYRETSVFFGAAKRFFENFFAGAAVVYKSLSIAKYGSAKTFSINAGLLYYLTRSLRCAFVIENPFGASFSGDENEIPTELAFALSYSPIDNASINIAVTKERDFPASLKFGTEYSPFRYFDLRFGFTTEPQTYSAGVGIKYGLVEIDYAALVHQVLPVSHQVGITVATGNIEERINKIKTFLKIK